MRWNTGEVSGWRGQSAPGVPLDLVNGEALVRVADQDALQQVPALRAGVRVPGQPVVAPHDPVQHLRVPQAHIHLLCC